MREHYDLTTRGEGGRHDTNLGGHDDDTDDDDAVDSVSRSEVAGLATLGVDDDGKNPWKQRSSSPSSSKGTTVIDHG